jgi:hypothetical protein
MKNRLPSAIFHSAGRRITGGLPPERFDHRSRGVGGRGKNRHRIVTLETSGGRYPVGHIESFAFLKNLIRSIC